MGVSVRWTTKRGTEAVPRTKFLGCSVIIALLVRSDSCLQERGSERHLYLLPFAKVSAAVSMLPYSLHQEASDP